MGWNKTKVCVLTPRAQNGFCITGIRKSWLGMGRCLKGDWTTSMDLVRNSYSTSVRWTHMCVCYTQPHLLQRQWINKQCQTKHPLRIHHFLSSCNKISRHHSLEKIKAATYTLVFLPLSSLLFEPRPHKFCMGWFQSWDLLGLQSVPAPTWPFLEAGTGCGATLPWPACIQHPSRHIQKLLPAGRALLGPSPTHTNQYWSQYKGTGRTLYLRRQRNWPYLQLTYSKCSILHRMEEASEF